MSTDALLKLWELCKKALPSFARDVANAAAEKSAAKAAARQASGGAKPKKNKPMNAEEQEARIAQLTALRDLYKDGQDPGDAARALHAEESMNISHGADSSDDSDSEEE